MQVAGRAERPHLIDMGRKAPPPEQKHALARRRERDRRERRAAQRNVPRPPSDPVELGSVLSFPASDPPAWIGRRKK
jgi:hypothetical protein